MAAVADVVHLLRRCEFVARPERVAQLTPLDLTAAVDDVLDIAQNGVVDVPVELRQPPPDGGSWDQYVEACRWWMQAMLDRPRPLSERLALFWHGHFTSAWWDIEHGWTVVDQVHIYRRNALGSFEQMAQEMATSPAMLQYLSNGVNQKRKPNQNFGRELLELFLLGAGSYAESDVEACARAWTGHNYDRATYSYVFKPTAHDTDLKTFFGVTRNWDGPDTIHYIVGGENPQLQLVCARFIARKLFESFAYPNPSATVVEQLAAGFVAGGMQLRPLVRAILLHPEFWSVASRQGLVRTPVELATAIAYYAHVTPEETGFAWRGESMGQILYNPPNVSGWRPNAYWLSTAAVSARAGLARQVTWTVRDRGEYEELYPMTAADAVAYVASKFGVDLSDVTRTALVAAHTAERSSVRWANWWGPTNLVTMMMATPEFNQA